MSPDVFGRLERRRERAAPRPLLRILAVAGACALATIGLAGPPIVDALSLSINGPAVASSSGLVQADRLTPPSTTTTTTTTLPPTTTVSAGSAADIQAVLDSTNAERAARGLGPLALHPQLTQAAVAHYTDQYRQRCSNLSHTGTNGSSPFDRIKATGLRYRSAGENIACGYSTPAAVMSGWMNSSGHRDNILNSSYTHIGIVAAPDAFGRMYWVQVFATPR